MQYHSIKSLSVDTSAGVVRRCGHIRPPSGRSLSLGCSGAALTGARTNPQFAQPPSARSVLPSSLDHWLGLPLLFSAPTRVDPVSEFASQSCSRRPDHDSAPTHGCSCFHSGQFGAFFWWLLAAAVASSGRAPRRVASLLSWQWQEEESRGNGLPHEKRQTDGAEVTEALTHR